MSDIDVSNSVTNVITEIADVESFDNEINKSVLTVCDFTAEWCGPCKIMGPLFEKACKEYPNVNFIKVDIDSADNVASTANISAVPTFQFYKNGEKVDQFRGAQRDLLTEFIEKHQ